MKYQRVLISLFAAALTAGTSSANSTVTLAIFAHDYGVINIDGSPVITFNAPGSYSDPLHDLVTLSLADGWHNFSIDYKGTTGQPTLSVYESYAYAGSWDPSMILQAEVLRSLDASGHTVNGLQGNYFNPDGTPYLALTFHPAPTGYTWDPIITYGEGPIRDGQGYYNGISNSNWAYQLNASSQFEERLTGQIYIGTNPHPTLGTLGDEIPPVIPPTDPPVVPGDAAPEPASWWLIAAALPLMLFSKYRPKGVSSHR